MKKIISMAVFSSLLISCSKEKKNTVSARPVQNTTTDTATVAGVLLELVDHDGKGQLKIHSDQYKTSGTIKIGPPCYFLRRDGKILSFSYPDVKVDHTIILQGKNGVQGILFKKDSIIYEDYFPTSTPYNIKEGADEIVYQDFAHRFYKNRD
ncbi:hypothetical protein B0A69_13930 [Chryseobacterium shigense]|uniref:Lipoprotein n=1 Tax=Chryseobacterium shigense TaxID=297244 RepID=A0A1N7HV53_9FLAO|nr:hypothetical protein [Chryseobacterium shigense]PQA93237.1 hypothetical protein B0A69_13930 [Chryseobacterium shigense]SIS28692.1 hypothetical protein SAMN05421639_101244 [Chryseobacterium shigense]